MTSKLTTTAALLASSIAAQAGAAGNDAKPGQTLYEQGSQPRFTGPENLFSGDVQVEVLFPDNDSAAYSAAYVTFAPSARTAWHSHPAGQHLVVTSGTAITATRDGRVIRFEEGESVWCPGDIDHWHGATPDATMTHLVITGSKNGENVQWKEKVTESDYLSAIQQSAPATADVSALSTLHQQLIPVSAFAAKGDQVSLKTALIQALEQGVTISQLKETLIHLYAYTGFPRSLNALGVLMQVVEARKTAGKKDNAGETPTMLPPDQSSQKLGETVQTELVGRPVSGPLFDFAPGINAFLQSHLFGDIFARGVLSKQDREIVTVSALSVLYGAESQLGSHISIASNTGISPEQLAATADLLESRVSRTSGQNVATALSNFLAQ